MTTCKSIRARASSLARVLVLESIDATFTDHFDDECRSTEHGYRFTEHGEFFAVPRSVAIF
jgi:hypothetical protein